MKNKKENINFVELGLYRAEEIRKKFDFKPI
jgi:hypothetical protein